MSSKTKTTATMEEATPALVPKLRFPEFRGAVTWREGRIADIAVSESSSRALNKLSLRSEGYPVYGADSCVGFIDSFDQADDYIAIVKDGSGVGRLALKRGKSSILGTLAYIKCKPGYETKLSWLYYCLNSLDLRQFIKGSGIPHIYFSDYATHEVLIPPLPEQQQIAECLSSVDELMAAQARKVDALKTHKKGLMQQLFPREGETQPRLRFPEFQNAGEWQVKPLGRAAENLDNRRRPITSSDREAGDVPYYGASGIVDYVEGFIFDEDLLCVSEDGANLVARTYPIAFPISGKTWVNNHAHVLRFEKSCTQKFVEVYLNSIKLDDFITGMAQPKLNKAMLDKISIPYPEVPEQQRIADCLTSLDDLIAAQTQKHEALKTHKKGLMQQLFPSPEEVGA